MDIREIRLDLFEGCYEVDDCSFCPYVSDCAAEGYKACFISEE